MVRQYSSLPPHPLTPLLPLCLSSLCVKVSKGGKVWHLKAALARMVHIKTTTEIVLLDVFSDLKVRHTLHFGSKKVQEQERDDQL